MKMLDIHNSRGQLLGWWAGRVDWGPQGANCLVVLWPRASSLPDPVDTSAVDAIRIAMTGYEVRQVAKAFTDVEEGRNYRHYLVAIDPDGMPAGFWDDFDAVRFENDLV